MMHDPPSKKLSVVVVASNNVEALKRTLNSLEGQAESPDTEVIAVSNFDGAIEAMLKQRFPFVRFRAFPRDATVADLRTRGVDLSNGKIIAFVEDYGFADPQWCAEIQKAHDSDYAVVGGAVENKSPGRLLNWAVYFLDYGKYMPPLRAGVVTTLSGINVSYKREALQKIEETFHNGFHETFVHEELKRRGHDLCLAPSAIIFLYKDFRFKDTCQSFFTLARSFAKQRVVHASKAQRAFLTLGSCLLPILLPVRVGFRILPKQRHLSELVLCLPHLVLLAGTWAAGEFCGYLFGKPTNAENSTPRSEGS